jgi:hypothetical protein
MSMGFDKSKFSFPELTMNSNGKQSGSGFIGVIMGLTGCASFIAAMVAYFLKLPQVIDVMQEILMLIGAATVLLGVRKFVGNKSGFDISSDPIDASTSQK